jgi:hypothetical protein
LYVLKASPSSSETAIDAPATREAGRYPLWHISIDGNLAEDFFELRRRWFDPWIKEIYSGVDEEPPVRVFEMGGGSGQRGVRRDPAPAPARPRRQARRCPS